MRVALLHNARPDIIPAGVRDDTFEEYDRPETVTAIAAALVELGLAVEPVLADRRLPWRLEDGRYDFAFNIAEGAGRRCREAVPAAICELLDVPVTGSDALTLAVTHDKAVARRLVSPDVPVAPATLVASASDEASVASLRYPAIVKPNDEGSSKGIDEDAVVADEAAAIARCRWLRDHYACPVLIEEYMPGAEVTVGVTGNGASASVLGMMEIAPVSAERDFVYSLDVKRNWRQRVRYHIPPRLPLDVLAMLERLALLAYRLLGCRDFARMDFRLDGAGLPRFLECNALPGLDPDNSDIVIMSAPVRPYRKLVQGIFLDAAQRNGVRIV